MQAGAILIDHERREQRFRVARLLSESSAHQIALAHDTHLDDKLVCCKTPSFAGPDSVSPDERCRALRQELDFLTLPSHLLPEPLDWLQVESTLGRVPVLVYEYQHGESLHHSIVHRFPNGVHPLRALMLFRELVRFATDIHRRGYLFRCFDPRHVILGLDDVIHLVGTGNASRLGERPSGAKFCFDIRYVAPEIRHERSGAMQSPAADLYSLGALLSFMLTGIEPREAAESPLMPDAYEMLRRADPPGLDLIVARCLQPLAKKRPASAEDLLALLSPEALPTRSTPGFGLVQLPDPWPGPEELRGNRGTRSQISAGPLISARSADQPLPHVGPERPDVPLVSPEADLQRPGERSPGLTAPQQAHPGTLARQPEVALQKEGEGESNRKVMLLGAIIILLIVTGFTGCLLALTGVVSL